MITTMTAPAGVERVRYGKSEMIVSNDGTLDIPCFAAAALAAIGFKGDAGNADVDLCDAAELMFLSNAVQRISFDKALGVRQIVQLSSEEAKEILASEKAPKAVVVE